MSHRPCPHCGAPLPDPSRFCGQCGGTIGPAAADVHEEVTVARDAPDIEALLAAHDKEQAAKAQATQLGIPARAPGPPPPGTLGKTLLDASPFGSDAAPAPRSIPTPLVPPPEPGSALLEAATPSLPATGRAPVLAATLADPEAQERAAQLRDQIFGARAAQSAEASGQSPPAPPAGPGGPLMKTMLLGGDAPQTAAAAMAAHLAAQQAQHAQQAPAPRPDASPLSRSVLAPQSWRPPAPASGQPPSGSPPPGSVQPAPVVGVGAAAPEPEAPRAAPAAPATAQPPLRTMLGMPATDLPAPGAAPPPPQAAPLPPAQKTMLGVAIPGIAPTHAPQGEPDLRSKQSTMLGVAIPGVAPTHAGHQGQQGTVQMQARPPVHIPSQVQNTALGIAAPPLAPIVPAPPPLVDEPLPESPAVAPKRGVPALAVVGILIALVLVAGGVGAFFALRPHAPLTAQPQLDENGRESLKIGCATCPDGTVVALGASSATITGGAAVLPLPAPLSIGDNDLPVKIDRPESGRDEEVKVHVPVAYRVRTDLTTLSAKPPAITVRVEATPGSEATVENEPVKLDANGKGSYAIDLSKETQGMGDTKPIERKLSFAITPNGGKPETGQLTARTSAVALLLDAPGLDHVTEKTTAAVAGQTRPNATVTIDGQSAPVDAQGRFGVRVELAALGERTLEIVASAPPLAPRIVKARIVRVASLADAAKELDAKSPIGFDAFGADPASKAGQSAMIEGEVVEARASGGHTLLLVDDRKTCAKGASCVVRAMHGEELALKRGDLVRVYGRVVGPVTAGGKTVPDVEASLVLTIKAAK
ncbi:MAG: hypothetical protein KF819_16930 [Labilithrix sp.]|nr:hypothetical protein [Labilithrix sp.]